MSDFFTGVPEEKPCEHGRSDYRICPHCLGIGSASQKPDAPREWTISNGKCLGDGVRIAILGPRTDGDVKVIEHSAYEAVKKSREYFFDKWQTALEQLEAAQKEIEHWKKKYGGYVDKWCATTHQLDAERAMVAEQAKELEERRMATPTMNAVHMLQTELEKAQARVRALESTLTDPLIVMKPSRARRRGHDVGR